MGFLSGWFIAGAGAIALPIIFHMIRRTPSGRVPFSTLMFLQPSPPRINKRSRIEHWFLLLLRGAALVLLALAFARPFLRSAESQTAVTADARQVAVLLDTSASMQRDGLWDEAVARVVRVVNAAGPSDRMAVYQFDRDTTPVVSFSEWDELDEGVRADVVKTRLKELEPGWAAGDLGKALIYAAEELESLELDDQAGVDSARSILLVSDLQRGSRTESLGNYEWPERLAVSVEQVEPESTTNAGLQLLTRSETAADRVRVRVTNAADSDAEQFNIRWVDDSGRSAEPLPVYVAPGRSKTVTLTPPPQSGPRASIVLDGDDHSFDNAVYVDRLQPLQLAVLYLGADESNDPTSLRFYLERAFPAVPSRTVRMLPPTVNGVPTPLDDTVTMVVVGDTVPTERASELKRYVEGGGTLLCVAQSTAGLDSTAPLLAAQAFTSTEATVEEYAMVRPVDYEHPVFAPFADAQFADFSDIHIWKHRSLPEGVLEDARVLARFDDGDPAIVEKSLGRGRLFLFTSGWNPTDSQLALSTKFVPLLNGLLEHGRRTTRSLPRMEIGDELSLDQVAEDVNGEVFVAVPGGEVKTLPETATTFDETTLPGVYQVTAGPAVGSFAVNLAASESNTAPLPLEHLEALDVQLEGRGDDEVSAAAAADLSRQLRIQELEKRQKLWRWLVLAALAALLLETWLAGRIARSQIASESGGLQGETA